jgi:hypothetical protein
MASESLNAFIELYNTKADKSIEKAVDKIAKKQVQLDEFNQLYPIVKAEAESLGQLENFNNFFPEGGGFNGGDPLLGLNPTFVSMVQIGDEFGKNLKKLERISDASDDLERANQSLTRAQSQKEEGGEQYLNRLKAALINIAAGSSSLGAASSDAIIEKILLDPESYEEIADFEIDIDGPSGLKTSQEAYLALKEMFDSNEFTSAEEEEVPSPINQVLEETDEEEIETEGELASIAPTPENPALAEVQSSGTLNIPEEIENVGSQLGEGEASVEPEASPINVEETSTPEPLNEAEPESSIESLSINQLEESAPSPSEGTLGAIEGAISNVSNITNVSELSNAENLTGGAISNITENLTGGSISNIAENLTGGAINNFTDNLVKQGGSASFLEEGASSVINNLTESTGLGDVVSKTTKNVSNLTNSIFNQGGGLTESLTKNIDNSKASSLIEKSSDFTSFPVSNIVKPEPVTKNDIVNVGKDISSNVSSGINTSLDLGGGEPQSRAERRADKKEERQQAREEKKELKEQQKQGVNVNSDFSSLEKRLKNIELLLMGPLEVKIKN